MSLKGLYSLFRRHGPYEAGMIFEVSASKLNSKFPTVRDFIRSIICTDFILLLIDLKKFSIDLHYNCLDYRFALQLSNRDRTLVVIVTLVLF